MLSRKKRHQWCRLSAPMLVGAGGKQFIRDEQPSPANCKDGAWGGVMLLETLLDFAGSYTPAARKKIAIEIDLFKLMRFVFGVRVAS